MIEERTGTGVATNQYVWSTVYVDAMVLRDRNADGNPGTGDLGMEDSGLEQRLYVTHDANYNVTGLIDDGGDVVERFRQDPYGTVTVLAGNWSPTTDNYSWIYLHQGGRYDGIIGLYHFRWREFSSALGRWVQQDPIRYADGLSLYANVGSNPLNRVDAWGLQEATTQPTTTPTTQPTTDPATQPATPKGFTHQQWLILHDRNARFQDRERVRREINKKFPSGDYMITDDDLETALDATEDLDVRNTIEGAIVERGKEDENHRKRWDQYWKERREAEARERIERERRRSTTQP